MTEQTFEFEMPEPFLFGESYLIHGNFIAQRASGYYNGNKTSWHVFEVVWFFGLFNGTNSWDNSSLEWITKICKVEFNLDATVSSCTVNGVEAQYVAIQQIGEHNKREAKKLIEANHRERGHVLMYSKSKSGKSLKHQVQTIMSV